MKTISHLIIRADASPIMGTGHVMRCIALAQWARVLAIPCTLMGRFQVPWVEQRLAHEGVHYFPLLGEIPQKENAQELLKSLEIAPQNSWVVLDGYHFTLECQEAVRAAGFNLLIIDDYAHLPEYSCDILLNQNIGAENITYKGNIGQKCLGLEYVLLRQEFIQAKAQAEKRLYPSTPQNLLLTLGGGDFLPYVEKLAPYLSVPEMAGRTLRVIAGAMNKNAIKKTLLESPAHVEILHNVHDMPSLLLDTDLCISAGGSTCWELCCLKVPFLTVEVAENQYEIVTFLAQHGIAQNIFHIQEHIFGQMVKSFNTFHPKLPQNVAVDGEGGKKIILHMQNEKIVTALNLRQAQLKDADFVLEVANDPLTRAMSFQQKHISYDEHTAWFTRQIEKNYPFYIASYNNTLCAYVRFALENSQHIISIAVHKKFRRRGLGEYILQQACKKYFSETQAKSILAYIKKTNPASLRTFQKVGFLEVPCDKKDSALLELQG